MIQSHIHASTSATKPLTAYAADILAQKTPPPQAKPFPIISALKQVFYI
jgi:hypothetical protein